MTSRNSVSYSYSSFYLLILGKLIISLLFSHFIFLHLLHLHIFTKRYIKMNEYVQLVNYTIVILFLFISWITLTNLWIVAILFSVLILIWWYVLSSSFFLRVLPGYFKSSLNDNRSESCCRRKWIDFRFCSQNWFLFVSLSFPVNSKSLNKVLMFFSLHILNINTHTYRALLILRKENM